MIKLLEWPWSLIPATAIFFTVSAIISAIVGWRDRQRLANAALGAPSGGGAGAGGTGSGQPPTVAEQPPPGRFERARQWLKKWLEKENLWKNWLAFPVIMIGIISIISFIVALAFPKLQISDDYSLRPWLPVFFCLTAWLFSQKENVEPDQAGLKKFFGKIIQKVGEGPSLVPPWLFTLTRYPLLQFDIQIGAKETKSTLRLLQNVVSQEALESCQTSLDEPLEVNFAPPEQAKWTLDYLEEEAIAKGNDTVRKRVRQRELTYAKDPMNSRLTAKMRVTFVVRIDAERLDDFARNIVTPERAILELNELGRAIVGRWCGKRTAAFVSRNIGLLGREVLYHAEDLVGESNPTQLLLTQETEKLVTEDQILPKEKETKETKGQKIEKYVRRKRENVNKKPWGLDIVRTEVHALGLPEAVNTAVADIAKSRAEATAQSNRADGEKAERAKKGIGDARAVRAMNLASASESGKFNVAMKAAVDMVQKGNVVFSGDNPVAVATAQIKAAVDAYQPPKAQPPSSQNQPPKGGSK